MEHDLYLDSESQLVIKITHIGFFGNHPGMTRDGKIKLRPGIGDDQRVLGIVGEGLACQLVTEQPRLVGTRPTREGIDTYIDALDFRWIDHAKAYFRLRDGIGVFDVHGGNFSKVRAARSLPSM